MRTTSRDVARLAGVSQPTVSRALRGDSRVAVETQERVRSAARELSYVPSNVGRSLRVRATGQVAVVADIRNALYPLLMPPVQEELTELGYRIVLLAEPESGDGIHPALLDHSVDGAILTTTTLNSAMPAELTRRGVPFVILNRLSAVVDADTVTADNAAGAAEVARLLCDLGHRDIAVILGPTDISTARDRERGFLSELADCGVAVPSWRTVRGDFTFNVAAEQFTRLMSAQPQPTAVFCINDVSAIGALNAARALGLRVPEDITVVGFDDLDVAAWPVFALTTVHNPVEDLARRAARLLLERIAGTGAPRPVHHVAPVELRLRASHGAPGRAAPGSR